MFNAYNNKCLKNGSSALVIKRKKRATKFAKLSHSSPKALTVPSGFSYIGIKYKYTYTYLPQKLHYQIVVITVQKNKSNQNVSTPLVKTQNSYKSFSNIGHTL